MPTLFQKQNILIIEIRLKKLRGKFYIGKVKLWQRTDGSEDKYFEALDFVINVLKKHEQILDKSIQELTTLTEYLENINALNSKVENAEEKINTIQKEVTDIVGGRSNMPKGALQASVEELGISGL